MKKRVLAVMLAGGMVLGAQTGVWAASDTSNQKEGELTLLLANSLIDGSGANSEEFKKVIKQYEEENPGVKITLQGASQQDIKESFQTAALAGRGADIVMMDNSGHAECKSCKSLLIFHLFSSSHPKVYLRLPSFYLLQTTAYNYAFRFLVSRY